jgi:[protein-PII] uridylyltransferase
MFNPVAAMKSVRLAQQMPDLSAQRRFRKREWFTQYLGSLNHAQFTRDEINAHLDGMPARYWDAIDENELVWGLETIHRFLSEVARPDSPATMPILDVRHRGGHQGATHLMLCTWDRQGLLAKVAGCLSAMRINILQADVYTRADGIVLDIFRVCEAEGQPVNNAARIQELGFLIDGALSEPPRFASLWACSRHKFLSPASMGPPFISFDNVSWPESTVITIEAPDRLGLLHDILAALSDLHLNICHALVETDDALARDTFHVIDSNGSKIVDAEPMQRIRLAITNAVAW